MQNTASSLVDLSPWEVHFWVLQNNTRLISENAEESNLLGKDMVENDDPVPQPWTSSITSVSPSHHLLEGPFVSVVGQTEPRKSQISYENTKEHQQCPQRTKTMQRKLRSKSNGQEGDERDLQSKYPILQINKHQTTKPRSSKALSTF